VTDAARAHRASSFGSVAETYDRFRPGPPLSAVAWVAGSRVATAVDIGAGTGALTRVLGRWADTVVAVEPDARMLEMLRRRSPQVPAVRSWAEHLPLRSGSVDLATVSSAWHWMDPDRTLAELERVVRPGGVLGVLWNGADRSVGWVSELLGTRDPSPGDREQWRTRHRFSLPDGSRFGELDSCVIDWSLRMGREELVGLAATYSSTITMSADERQAELARVGAVADDVLSGAVADDLLSGAVADRVTDGEGVEVPMSCRCWRAVRS
jgi:SAM-dependent methyltransferase